MPIPIALQLYSVREAAARDLLNVLERAASLGYAGIEPAGLQGMVPAQFRGAATGLGLEVCAVHAEPPAFDVVTGALAGDQGLSDFVGSPAAVDAVDRWLDEQADTGAPAVIVPMFEASVFGSIERVRRAAEYLNHLADRARRLGLLLGYHNHEWEFVARVDGAPAHHVLFDELDPRVCAEIDVYWVRVAGADPAAEIRRLGDRVRFLHLKDGPARDTTAPMTALGQGTLDLPGIIEAASAVRWEVVEIDHCAGDVWTALEESFRYLVERGLGRGRD